MMTKIIQKILFALFSLTFVGILLLGIFKIQHPPDLNAFVTEVPQDAIITQAKTYTGSAYNTPWGQVQVHITTQNGKVTAVSASPYPSSPPSKRAYSTLVSQVMKSHMMQGVSGATYTSNAFSRSLESAIAQAKTAKQL